MSTTPIEFRMSAVEQALLELAKAQARTQEQLDRSQARLDRTDAQIERTQEQLDRTDTQIQRTQANLDQLTDSLRRSGESSQAQLDQLTEALRSSGESSQARLDQLADSLRRSGESSQARLDQLTEALRRSGESSQARLDQLTEALRRSGESSQARLDQLAEAGRRSDETTEAFKQEMAAYKEERRKAEERIDRQWGELANKMGTLTEDIVAPGIPEIFKRVFGVEQEPELFVRGRWRHRSDPGRMQELDAVAMAGPYVLVCETRSRLRPADIPSVLQMLLSVRDFVPAARDRRVVGAVASFLVDPSLVTAGQRAGLIVVGLGRGLLEILNPPGFVPREF